MRYRFISSSTAKVTAYAPGHDFRARGAGVEGTIDIEDTKVAALDARFELARLDAGDMLGNRELKKFLSLDREPVATASLLAPIELETDRNGELHGRGRIRLVVDNHRKMEVGVEVRGFPPAGTATFSLTFTGLGYKPPKLLFLKVKDRIDIEIEAQLEAPDD